MHFTGTKSSLGQNMCNIYRRRHFDICDPVLHLSVEKRLILFHNFLNLASAQQKVQVGMCYPHSLIRVFDGRFVGNQ